MTLPFISYGGSSFLALSIGMGMVLALTEKGPVGRSFYDGKKSYCCWRNRRSRVSAISLAEKLKEWATIFSSLLISEEKNLR